MKAIIDSICAVTKGSTTSAAEVSSNTVVPIDPSSECQF